ncbi:glycerophosphoryl diester phosphodiesterase family protein [Herbihabitans rhizosphaerae]|uniref:Altered inheritance of mitochondria protein 6 n=1 Tax=Herbihabitans rhizosphaerae TaxID=1872711 RepID=A0A4Q7L5E3_9PSEU|nr:phosphatidylinositol-specific phospholipase C/glycerophosphodiester phosphodiesterase family protein [Herbihabitans rhizosphaerae]RZS43751.1 glycerophosphoryl diester phosphodiesterase family protein [Herbihabitans rhizosphaerae]
MRSRLLPLLLVALAALVGAASSPAAADRPHSPHRTEPLAKAHAHNDYEHARPLHDALDHGFTSVEADIFLVDGQLLVAHEIGQVDPERTLTSLYLEPLRQRVIDNHGTVYRGKPIEFQLLIDIKNSGTATYELLDRTLRDERYAFLFTHYRDGKVKHGAVAAVISGDRPRAIMEGQTDRLAFYDGRIADQTDLGPGADARLTALVSDNWTKLFTWTGTGEFPAAERAKLRDLVRRCHDAGQRIRFWATPDSPGPARDALWRELVNADVDHINTDDLAGLAEFLSNP